MKEKIKKYSNIMQIALINQIQYKMDFFINIIGCFIPIVVQSFMWNAIYKSSSLDIIRGYTLKGLLEYFIISSVVLKTVEGGFEFDICDDIKNGKLDKYILQPISYIQYRFSIFFGKKILELVLTVILVVGLISYKNIIFNEYIEGLRILLFALALILAVLLNFLVFYSISLVAFWLHESWGIITASRMVISILSGGILPLTFLGNTFEYILTYLPFKYIIYFPIQIFTQIIEYRLILKGYVVQIIWIVILIYVSKIIWRKGITSYISTGG